MESVKLTKSVPYCVQAKKVLHTFLLALYQANGF